MTLLFRETIGDCYKYREVLYNLVARDLKVKYKRTFLGYFWSLLNPILQMGVLSAVFSHIVKLGMKNYTLYLFSGLLTWNFFQTSLNMASLSFIESENFIKKVYLPKILFPLSKVVLRAIDFLFSLVALSLIGIVFGFPFHASWIWLPSALIIFCLFTLGASLIFAVMTVYFRDIIHLLTVFLQLLYFATPIIYPLSQLPPRYQKWMMLNPLVPELNLFHRILYEGAFPSPDEWAAAFGVAIIFFLTGLIILWRYEEDLVFRL